MGGDAKGTALNPGEKKRNLEITTPDKIHAFRDFAYCCNYVVVRGWVQVARLIVDIMI